MTDENAVEIIPETKKRAAQLASIRKQALTSRREQVNTFYLQGVSQAAIATRLGVSQTVISRDLRYLRDLWMEKSIAAISLRKAEELAKIDTLELTYWQAWEESKRDKEIMFSERVGEVIDTKSDPKAKTEAVDESEADAEADSEIEEKPAGLVPKPGAIVGTRVRETTRREGQSGNPAFLDGVMKCIDKRCQIMGLNAPTRNFNVDLEGLSDAQLERLAAGEDIIDILASAQKEG